MDLLDDIQAAKHPDAKDGLPGRSLFRKKSQSDQDTLRLLQGRVTALKEVGIDFTVVESADLQEQLKDAFETVIDFSN